MNPISIEKPETQQWSTRDFNLALGLLGTDPLFHRVPPDLVPDLVTEALTVGCLRAENVVKRYYATDPLKLASKLSVRVIFDITDRGRRAFVALSRYTPNPPTIVIFENVLRKCRERLVSCDGLEREFLSKLTNICVAHELYHHLERLNFEFVNLAHKVTILDLKLLKIEKSLSVLSEIAANAFAFKLMNLPALPCVIHEGIADAGDVTNGGFV